MLSRCLESIFSDNADTPCNVVVVDNASGDGVVEQVREEFPEVVVIQMDSNPGFAVAVNRGLDEITEPYVLMLNTDAVLEQGSLAAMLETMKEAGDSCAGVAPKMMLSAHANIIDAVGTVMPPDGASFNRGIGQCDLGQYDGTDEIFGVCFGATLLRRELFTADGVGPLYEGYFLYFEDSDWCMRARAQGYHFRAAPQALVMHLHSGSARNETLSFKYKLIELNTMKLVARTFESPARAASVIASRATRLLARTFIRRRFIRENLSTLWSMLSSLPQLLRERRQLQQRRNTSDRTIFALAAGEDAYFDTVAYEPQRCIESLIDTYLRMRRTGGMSETGAMLSILYRLQQETGAGMKLQLSETDREVISNQPGCVRKLLESGMVTGKEL